MLMSTIIVTFISLFCTYVPFLKNKMCPKYMFGVNFDILKTNFGLKALYRVKKHLKLIKIKYRSSEL